MSTALKIDAPLDARAALREAHAMSRANSTGAWGFRVDRNAPWLSALRGLTKRSAWVGSDDNPALVAERLFAAAGATPSELAWIVPRGSRSWVRKFSHGRQAPRASSLSQERETEREIERSLTTRLIKATLGVPNGVRHTHRVVHRALNGGPAVDALGNECEWCRRAGGQ